MQTVQIKRFQALDSLRGIAAMVVVCHHGYLSVPEVARNALHYLDFTPLSILMAGRFAVMLFFVLSGFVLSLPYFAGTNSSYGPYIARRFCRLYLPFAFAICVAALLCHWLGGFALPMLSDHLNRAWSRPVTANVVASHLMLLTGNIRLDDPVWSLVVEMRISIVFPLLVLWVARFGWKGVAAGVVVAFVCAKLKAALGGEYTADSLAGSFLFMGRYAPFFLFGIITAARLDGIRIFLMRMSRALHAVLCVGAIITHMTLVHMGIEDHGYADVFYGLFAIYLVASCVTFPRLASGLSGGVFSWLGDISYSLYLIHVPVLLAAFYLLYERMPHAAIVAMALPAALVAAHAMHYAIERPAMVLGRRAARRLEGQDPVVARTSQV